MLLNQPNPDRMSTALLVALGIHAFVVLLVGFQISLKPSSQSTDSLDVVLVNWQSEKAPEEADYLAQADQLGGGDTTELVRPSQPVTAPVPNPDAGEAQMNVQPSTPAPSVEDRERLTTLDAEQSVDTEINEDQVDPQPIPSAEELMLQAQRMAQMQPEISQRDAVRSKTPRRKFISANTKKYEYASYMQAWVAKVERIGNLNYPEQARRNNLTGDLILTVGVYPDGSIESINVMRSSGKALLDQAAIKIVRIAAPFSPLSEEITAETDILNITRTWRFSQGNRLDTGR